MLTSYVESQGVPQGVLGAKRPRFSARIVWLTLLAAVSALGVTIATLVHVPIASTARSSTVVIPLNDHLTPPPVEEQKLLEVTPETARVLNAKQPFVTGPLPPAAPYHFVGSAQSKERAADCLAAAAWYEIGDDAVGARAVMQVVLNRVRHPAFQPTICGVVFQGSERSTGCQFTFTCDGALAHRAPATAAWARARALAVAALDGAVDRDVGYATHYHADYVVPYWANENDKIAAVGPHIFYRWKGYWGTRASFTRQPGTDEPGIPALARLSPAHAAIDGAALLALPGVPADAVVAANPVNTPALVIAGVREKSLRGAVVRGQQPGANQFFLQLDGATFPGNYATAAVALCKGKPNCLVLGWRDGTHMSQGLPLNDTQRTALSFYFAHDEQAGDVALWNCQQMPRSNAAQCLSAAGPVPIGVANRAENSHGTEVAMNRPSNSARVNAARSSGVQATQ